MPRNSSGISRYSRNSWFQVTSRWSTSYMATPCAIFSSVARSSSCSLCGIEDFIDLLKAKFTPV